MTQFKVGDKVRILSDAYSPNGEVTSTFVSAVGSVGTIENKDFSSSSHRYYVCGLPSEAGYDWWYNVDQLELVEDQQLLISQPNTNATAKRLTAAQARQMTEEATNTIALLDAVLELIANIAQQGGCMVMVELGAPPVNANAYITERVAEELRKLGYKVEMSEGIGYINW